MRCLEITAIHGVAMGQDYAMGDFSGRLFCHLWQQLSVFISLQEMVGWGLWLQHPQGAPSLGRAVGIKAQDMTPCFS